MLLPKIVLEMDVLLCINSQRNDARMNPKRNRPCCRRVQKSGENWSKPRSPLLAPDFEHPKGCFMFKHRQELKKWL